MHTLKMTLDEGNAYVQEILGKYYQGEVMRLTPGYDEDISSDSDIGGKSYCCSDLGCESWHQGPLVYVPKYTGGSDYGGGSVCVANHRYIIEHWGDEVGDIYGGYGTYEVAIPLAFLALSIDEDDDGDRAQESRELVEVLNALSEYPLIDDELHSEIEREQEDEAWESFVRSDYSEALAETLADALSDDHEAKHGCHDCDTFRDCALEIVTDALDELEESELRDVFEHAASAGNIYWEDQSGAGSYIDAEEVAKATDYDFPGSDLSKCETPAICLSLQKYDGAVDVIESEEVGR